MGTSRAEAAHTRCVILSETRRLLAADNDPQASMTSACDIPNAGGWPFEEVVSDPGPAQASRRRQNGAIKGAGGYGCGGYGCRRLPMPPAAGRWVGVLVCTGRRRRRLGSSRGPVVVPDSSDRIRHLERDS